MTFVEAAIEILKREGKPTSSRRLAELAIKLNLLSVVGRDPEATMQERLEDAMGHASRHPDLVRVKPDTFGLHVYPPRPEPSNGTQAHAPAAGAAAGGEAAGEPKKGRRRRRRGGRRGEEGAPGAAAGESDGDEAEGPAPTEAEAAEAAEGLAVEASQAAVAAEAAAAPVDGQAADKPAGEKRRRRRRGGRGRKRRDGSDAGGAESGEGNPYVEADEELDAAEQEESEAHERERPTRMPQSLPPEAAAAGTPSEELTEGGQVEAHGDGEGAAEGDEIELLGEGEAGDEEGGEDLEGEIDHHTGPLLAPAFGAEDVTRTDDDRTVRPEIRGSRDDRRNRERHKGRRDRHKGGDHKGAEAKPQHKAPETRAQEARPHEPRAQEARPQQEGPRPQHEGRPAAGGLLGAVLEVLRGSDGRPMHVRQIVDAAVKRRLVDDRTAQHDVARITRVALVREQREREAEGLRPRVRALGAGSYAPVDRKLDPELFQAERELSERAARLRDATRAGVRRRLGRMSAPAFDALGRTLLDKMGITSLELLRRGEGVTYWGGTRVSGVSTVRTLAALRAGEGEVNRRAVGELRAGLAAKGYDEGLLFSAGRPNPEALAELKNGGVTLYDGNTLAQLLIKHGLGVHRVVLPVDYLDVEFFEELNEG